MIHVTEKSDIKIEIYRCYKQNFSIEGSCLFHQKTRKLFRCIKFQLDQLNNNHTELNKLCFKQSETKQQKTSPKARLRAENTVWYEMHGVDRSRELPVDMKYQ